jgi:hypothetical protein
MLKRPISPIALLAPAVLVAALSSLAVWLATALALELRGRAVPAPSVPATGHEAGGAVLLNDDGGGKGGTPYAHMVALYTWHDTVVDDPVGVSR